MKIEIGGFFTYRVLIIFRIMATIECPEAFSKNAVKVLGFLYLLVLTHNDDVRFHKLLLEAGGLSVESFNHPCVILRKHRWDRIPLRRKLEDGEIIIVLAKAAIVQVVINVREFILVR